MSFHGRELVELRAMATPRNARPYVDRVNLPAQLADGERGHGKLPGPLCKNLEVARMARGARHDGTVERYVHASQPADPEGHSVPCRHRPLS